MNLICVATFDSKAYYSILDRLKRAGITFKSCTPSDVHRQECTLILTTTEELRNMRGNVIAVEELNENPAVMKAQLLSRLKPGKRELLVGIDPGLRIGVAIFYQNMKLISSTFSSLGQLLNLLKEIVDNVVCSEVRVKIGSGSPKVSVSVARAVVNCISDAVVEIVDERGTSHRSRLRNLTGDQVAAVRIAYRKGIPF